jgi:membrane-associated PAP2 superfamily phosphatase
LQTLSVNHHRQYTGFTMSEVFERPTSRPINLWVYLGIPVVTALILVLLELTSLDMDIAKLAYDPTAGGFIGKHSYFLENVLHDRAKQVVIALGVLSFVSFVASFFVGLLKPWKRELGCMVLSMALSTSFVTPMKVVTSVQCPWSLTAVQRAAQPSPTDRQTRPLLARRPCSDRLHFVRVVFRVP